MYYKFLKSLRCYLISPEKICCTLPCFFGTLIFIALPFILCHNKRYHSYPCPAFQAPSVRIHKPAVTERFFMIALKITEVKNFMNQFLCQEVFDHFLLQEAVIQTNALYHIDGTVQKEFYTNEEMEELALNGLPFLPYGMLRSQCFGLIRGKKTPTYFKFSLLLSPENLERTLAKSDSSFTANDISAVFLNVKFQNGDLTITTGISYRIFSTDRTLEHEWDALMKKFLTRHEIAFDEL